MPTKIHSLKEDTEAWECLHDIAVARYLDGECYAFARALHEGLGWPLIGLMEGEVIRHALVREPGGLLRDVSGATTAEEVCKTFGLPLPAVTREVRDFDLIRDEEPAERIFYMIRAARKIAEVLWPELPWRDSAAQCVTAFVDELESMCRRHRLWLRPMVPGAPMMLSEEIGHEEGYALTPTSDGTTFCIDRYFKTK